MSRAHTRSPTASAEPAAPAPDGRRRRVWPARAWALLGLAAWAMPPAQAQSLHVLHGVARGYDASFLAARLQADAAGHKAEQALALKRPTLNATAGSTLTSAQTPWNSVTSSTTLQHSAGLVAQYTLFNRGNELTMNQAELGVVLARAQLQVAEQDLAVRVAQAYFDVLVATDALATVQMGRQNLQPRPLARPVQLPVLRPANVDDWVALADEHNPNLRQVRLGLQLSRLEREKARAARLPTVGLQAALQLAQSRVHGQSQASDGSSMAFGPNQGHGVNASVGVQISMPLYSGGAIPQRERETEVLAMKSEADLEAARRGVAQATRIAFYSLRSLMARVAALEAAESSSALALEATQLGYQVGVRVNLDVLNAQTQLNQAQRDLARARYDVMTGLLKLRQTTGVLQTADVSELSTLLAK